MMIQSNEDCGRTMAPKDCLLSDLQLDRDMQGVLRLTRLYMQTFAMPDTMAWVAALANAEEIYGTDHGPQIAVQCLRALQSVRRSRRSVFQFNSPTCPTCAAIVTEHERRLMNAIVGCQTCTEGQARLELMMLCEGNDIDRAIAEIMELNIRLANFRNAQRCQTPMPAGCV